MIRPIPPPAGTITYYIILNDDWEVDSMSQQLYEGLGKTHTKQEIHLQSVEGNYLSLTFLPPSPLSLSRTERSCLLIPWIQITFKLAYDISEADSLL